MSKKYKWNYATVGGATRVNILSGEDIKHLGELDQKKWTVLSCPTVGLEIDEKSLQLIDLDHDGKIRVNEVVATADWLCAVLNDPDLLLQGKDSIRLTDINQLTPQGQAVYAALEKFEKDEVSLADVEAAIAAVVKNESAASSVEDNVIPPYGANSDRVEAIYDALNPKVMDYFMRCRLVQFDKEANQALDVQVARIEAISAEDLTTKTDEIATYPLARVNAKGLIDLKQGINPVWAAYAAELASILTLDQIDAEQWAEIGAKISAYKEAKAALAGAQAEAKKAAEEADNAEFEAATADYRLVEKLLLLLRDFYKLLKNFVTFQDFYDPNLKLGAIFQAGTLYIDQRAMELCIKVNDMGKQTAQAPASGMYLLFCDCESKKLGKTMKIVAVVTNGEVSNLMVGKNGVFYDRDGNDWDATVTSIVDNPISIRQAFWTPYRKMAKSIEDTINKRAAEKDAKVMAEANSKITTTGNAPADAAKEIKPPFDIAKFAGIFAAIGMALGLIGAALAQFFSAFTHWYHWVIFFLVLLLLISGPSMIMAWLKLRKRNLAPVLNANGWAINSSSLVNIGFGATLTAMPKYPKIKSKDPFKTKRPAWKNWFWGIVCVLAICCCLWLCGAFAKCGCPSPLKKQAQQVEQVQEVQEAPAETAAEPQE